MLAKELRKNGFDLKAIKALLSSLHVKVLGQGQELLVIYDGLTNQRKAWLTAADENQEYSVKMKGHSSAIIIDITNIRRQWEKIIM